MFFWIFTPPTTRNQCFIIGFFIFLSFPSKSMGEFVFAKYTYTRMRKLEWFVTYVRAWPLEHGNGL